MATFLTRLINAPGKVANAISGVAHEARTFQAKEDLFTEENRINGEGRLAIERREAAIRTARLMIRQKVPERLVKQQLENVNRQERNVSRAMAMKKRVEITASNLEEAEHLRQSLRMMQSVTNSAADVYREKNEILSKGLIEQNSEQQQQRASMNDALSTITRLIDDGQQDSMDEANMDESTSNAAADIEMMYQQLCDEEMSGGQVAEALESSFMFSNTTVLDPNTPREPVKRAVTITSQDVPEMFNL